MKRFGILAVLALVAFALVPVAAFAADPIVVEVALDEYIAGQSSLSDPVVAVLGLVGGLGAVYGIKLAVNEVGRRNP